MKRILKYNFLAMAALSLSLSSCYEDKGNYDYRELTTLNIDTVGTSIREEMTAIQLENFKMPVKVEYGGDKSKLQYEWKLYPQVVDKDEDEQYFADPVVLSRQEVLDTTIYEVPGKYYLVYTITDPTQDVKEYLRIKLNIESALSRGLCVLDEQDGVTDLHMIKTATLLTDLMPEDESVVHHVFSNVNGRTETDGRFVQQYGANRGNKKFFFFTEKGGYEMDPNSFKIRTDDFTSLFSFPMAITANPQAYMVTSRPMEVMVNDGYVYTLDHTIMGAVTFGDRLKGDYVAAPFLPNISTQNFATVIYDTKNGRFAPIDPFGSAVGSFNDTPEAEFNLNKIGLNMDIKYMENGFNGYTYAIFKDKDNNAYFMYVSDFSGKKEMPLNKYEMAACPDLNDQSIYAFAHMGNVCFYTSGSALYQYKYASKNEGTKVRDFNGETITTMQVFKKDGHPQDGKLLMISTAQAGKGKVYLIAFDELNGALDTQHMSVYEGFAQVKDVYFKE